MTAFGRLELAAAPLFALVTACSTFEGLTLAKSRNTGDAGSTKQRCHHATPQPPSLLSSGPGEHELVVAVRTVDFGEAGPGRSSPDFSNIGFDLDGKCTGQGEGPSCRKPSWADDHPDGPDGRDNAAASPLATDDAGNGAPAANLNDVMHSAGLLTTVLRIRGYNGTPVDWDVEVALFAATRSPDPLTSVPNPALWDGNDVWKPLVEWTAPADAPDGGSLPGPWLAKYPADGAYVSNNVLVAHFPLTRGAAAYNFSNAWIQARIEDDGLLDGKRSLRDGVFAGRLSIDDALAGVEFALDPNTLQATCTDSPGYLAAKKRACALADIGFSGDDPSAPCDATSWAWRFEAEPALLSDEIDPSRESDFRKCPPALSPANDHCTSLE
jgi:hypothetical protein